jgi:hypothetical protein
MEVDPTDPMSVQRAMLAAEDAAEEAAQSRVVEPRKSAARAVSVQPVPARPGVDYSGLAAESKRISEQIRQVYAEALQRELIGRLMREQIERDDEDDIELLMMVA